MQNNRHTAATNGMQPPIEPIQVITMSTPRHSFRPYTDAADRVSAATGYFPPRAPPPARLATRALRVTSSAFHATRARWPRTSDPFNGTLRQRSPVPKAPNTLPKFPKTTRSQTRSQEITRFPNVHTGFPYVHKRSPHVLNVPQSSPKGPGGRVRTARSPFPGRAWGWELHPPERASATAPCALIAVFHSDNWFLGSSQSPSLADRRPQAGESRTIRGRNPLFFFSGSSRRQFLRHGGIGVLGEGVLGWFTRLWNAGNLQLGE